MGAPRPSCESAPRHLGRHCPLVAAAAPGAEGAEGASPPARGARWKIPPKKEASRPIVGLSKLLWVASFHGFLLGFLPLFHLPVYCLVYFARAGELPHAIVSLPRAEPPALPTQPCLEVSALLAQSECVTHTRWVTKCAPGFLRAQASKVPVNTYG